MQKAEQYDLLYRQLSALLEGETDPVAKMANTAAVLHESFGFWWTGFYRVASHRHTGLDPVSLYYHLILKVPFLSRRGFFAEIREKTDTLKVPFQVIFLIFFFF